jgi:endonuclease III
MTSAVSISHRTYPNAKAIARILSSQYGDHAHANKVNPLSELLFILCSLQTNEDLYKASYARLRARFPSFRLLADASEDEIAGTIELGGLARQKARVIRQILSRLTADFGTPTLAPLRSMSDTKCEDYLLALPGVGKKTARCVMMYSLGRSVFPVDSNCWRICRRLGWVRATRPDKSCSPRDMDRLQAGIPIHLRFKLHVNMVSHGRFCCLPANPRCEFCGLRQYCRKWKRTRAIN